MASNSPFHVEDQTDEDFFDKLVDDDFSPNEAISSSSSSVAVVKFIDDDESDDAKGFANLSMDEKSREEYKLDRAKPGNESEDADAAVSVDAQADKEKAASLVATEALDFDTGGGPLHPINKGEVQNVPSSESTGEIVSANSEGLGIKEVGWSSFYADTSDNGVHGVGSYSDFFSELGDNSGNFHETVEQNVFGGGNLTTGTVDDKTVGPDNSRIYGQYLDNQDSGKSVGHSPNPQNLGDSQYWENMYPGWKYDPSTGQWVLVDGQDASRDAQVSYENSASDWGGVSDGKSEVAFLRQSTSFAVGTVAEMGTTECVSNLNQVSQPNNGYPEHMVFDPQYPGWYFDTIAQEWRSLEMYDAAAQSKVQAHQDQQIQNGYVSTSANANDNTGSVYGVYGQIHRQTSQDIDSTTQPDSWNQSHHDYNQQGISMWQPEDPAATGAALYPSTSSSFGGNHQADGYFAADTVGQQPSNIQTFENASQSLLGANGIARANSFVPDTNLSRQFNAVSAQHGRSLSSDFFYSQNSVDVAQQSGQMSFSSDFNDSQRSGDFAQQSYQSGQQFSYASNAGRSPDGRPAHALVAFGFGGKLIVTVENSSSLHNSSFGSQAIAGSTVTLLNLAEVVTGDANSRSFGHTLGYFRAICQQSLSGPLSGGSVGSKEIYKWLDESIANCESPGMDFSKGKLLKLLLSLLKISCHHYGKLRSPFGADTTLKESDTPEAAVAKLFASVKNNAYGALSRCLQQLPPEAQMQATASEVQSLLVSGRKMEALRCAQDGQLWGPALIIATQLGDQFYIDTVKQIALRQLVSGSPLRTLCLLIAGQPAEVFSTRNTSDGGLQSPMGVGQYHAQQPGTSSMLDDWEENLAVIAANRTKDDELVITHLGDCLWKERSEIVAAHICYLVAEKNFEPYSDAARLCLVGADHWKFPRTYASPEAIQRTELYEYSKVLGNSQYILMSFQPYKLLYAYMLAEVGKVADALKYCQAVSKSLKTGRAPEAETWKQLVLSLEERIRIYQQGGYTANLAPAKLVGKLLNFFDNTAHRVVGGLPPPVPPTSHSQLNEFRHQQAASRVSSSQSTMTMSSLMPSASMEPISQWAADGSRMTVQSRSVSEPDFGRTPRQEQVAADSTNGKSGDGVSGKASDSRTASRFGRFGFGSQLIKKTVGLVIRSKQSHEAKLGEQNKFYYDEKLKRWVEEGAETPAEEAALPPPPTTSSFMNNNNVSDHGNKSGLKNELSPSGGIPNFSSPTPSESSSGIPPMPGGSNQFSARGRMGVRARYVDTFNQGRGNPANMFQSPPAPSVKPAMPANTKFFVPAPASTLSEQGMETITESAPELNTVNETASLPATSQQFQTPTSSSPMALQRFPSMDNIKRSGSAANVNHSLQPYHSRRTASWSGGIDGAFSPPSNYEVKPLGEALGMSPSTFTPSPLGSNSSLGEDLQEVEL